MRPTFTFPFLALTTVMIVRAPATASAAPTACSGRYEISGAALVLGTPTGTVTAVTVEGSPETGLQVALGDVCTSETATKAPRDDVFVVRSRFINCGERPRFRLRLACAPDCTTLAGRMRSAGQIVAEFTATRVLPGSLPPPIPSTPPTPTIPPVPATPAIGPAPALTVTNPLTGRPGDVISVFGTDLDRDAHGTLWSGTPPYRVLFPRANANFGVARAEFAFVSSTELRVTVPAEASSGVIRLSERSTAGAPEPLTPGGPWKPA